MNENEFEEKLKNGEIEEIKTKEQESAPLEEGEKLELEDYQKFLEMLRQFKGYTSSAPTDTPKSFLDQIRFYVSGSTYRIYFYIKDAWKVLVAAVADHGELDGLADDDHSQYHNNARGDARYYTETEIDDTVVKLTGNQSINGTKSFLVIPSLPASDPTTDNQAVRKKYVDDHAGTFTNIATGFVSKLTPTDTSTTNLTIGFVPKIIFFYAVQYGDNRFSNGIAKGTADADNTVTTVDASANDFGNSYNSNCILIQHDGAAKVAGKVTTFGSTTTITWEVIAEVPISFSWTALA